MSESLPHFLAFFSFADNSSRKGFAEERDPVRLRDPKTGPVACYKCGGSSIPMRSLASDPEASWRPIVSCDYCNLHWHLDCLSPPLASMPTSMRKWMCPNHSDQVMPARRTVRSGLETVDVGAIGKHNNGNVVVVADEEPRAAIPHEDMVINNRRYRVPEKIIQLDFWNKIRAGAVAPAKIDKRARVAQEALKHATRADLDAANLILSFMHSGPQPEEEDEVVEEEAALKDEDVVMAEPVKPTPAAPRATSVPVARPAANGRKSRTSTPSAAPNSDGPPRRITLRLPQQK